ncbi:MAG: hypothetical protein HC906_06885 [Bacteroidales bacterium]|nr:hypothetical protein [Bacteroidales bacterium]
MTKRIPSTVCRNKIVWISLVLLTCSTNLIIFAQSYDLGWKGKEIVPLSSFTDQNKWIPGYNQGSGDSIYITTNDSCIFLHWKFGPGKRNKYAQCFQVLDHTISLSNRNIIAIDVKGSEGYLNRDIQIKFEDGTHQASFKWNRLANITRWCERISVLKNQFDNSGQINWNGIRVISFEVKSDASENDAALTQE